MTPCCETSGLVIPYRSSIISLPTWAGLEVSDCNLSWHPKSISVVLFSLFSVVFLLSQLHHRPVVVASQHLAMYSRGCLLCVLDSGFQVGRVVAVSTGCCIGGNCLIVRYRMGDTSTTWVLEFLLPPVTPFMLGLLVGSVVSGALPLSSEQAK